MRRHVAIGADGDFDVGLVTEGATTPWSVANWPGLETPDDCVHARYFYRPHTMGGFMYAMLRDTAPWLASTRLSEPLSPEARALVQAARGAK